MSYFGIVIRQGERSPLKPQFEIGQTVNARAFVDCFGKQVEQVSGLVVADIRRFDSDSMASYYRVKAHDPKQLAHYVEGAERFFEPA